MPEDKILEYIKRMNRPFGAVDVSANLKGAVPKTATQKIMVALAEKGDLVQKTYGKTTFFVANQAILEDMPAEKLASLESQYKTIDEENKVLGVDMKIASGELAKLKNTPTDAELAIEVEGAAAAVSLTTPLRAFNIIQKWSRVSIKSLACFAYETGRIYTTNSASLPDSDRALLALSLLTCYVSATVGSESPRTSRTTPRWYPLVSAVEIAQLEADWTKWRNEWVRRKKIFTTFWQLATDSLVPQQAAELAEDLGIEFDTPEHIAVERGSLCSLQPRWVRDDVHAYTRLDACRNAITWDGPCDSYFWTKRRRKRWQIDSNAFLAIAAASGALAQSSTSTSIEPLASKHFSYPSGIPYQADPDMGVRGSQSGYNLCNSTTEGPNSLCQTSFLNHLDDFCLWSSPTANETIGDTEAVEVAWCTKKGRGTRLIPAGALTGVQFMKTPDYLQVVGFIDQSQINLQSTDGGGELDPHGADFRGNPLGGLVYSNGFASNNGNNDTFQQVIEWHNFMGSNSFCFKICDPAGANAANFCQHIYDRIGVQYNCPNAAQNGTFEYCEGDDQDFPGVYTSNGQVVTYTQPAESLGVISSMPYTARLPASSNCVVMQSAALYTDLVSATTSGAAAATGTATGTGAAAATGTGKSSSGTAATRSGTSAGASSTGASSNSAGTTRLSAFATAAGVLFAVAFLS
ncbi:hypothetical protein A0H81_13913 [Grifola frondosa]|uniref:Homologous-pairing protein 2 winged helix domain-containing protein n=1 Tax=Grifola frondosa TaxID=5627 RepID=A0A1C7LNC2_GRIFR|nr:hypothetical protein A0H81_13913 [Grifola frondosa]